MTTDITSDKLIPEKTALQLYMGKATKVLQDMGIMPKEEDSSLVQILEEVKEVRPADILAIAQTVRQIGAFSQVIRDNVEEMHFATRYEDISARFDSIREDAKMLLDQASDGKITFGERLQQTWMKVRRGTPHARFDKIKELYMDVARDTHGQLEKEGNILTAYQNFRLALKNAEIISKDVLTAQETIMGQAKDAWAAAAKTVEQYTGADATEKSRLELARDEKKIEFEKQDKRYQLVKDVSENLTISYNVGETLIAKLNQSHSVKEQVYNRAVTFFTTNENVFTTLDALYASTLGLNEASKAVDAMADGMNKGLEDIAQIAGKVEDQALKAAYGKTLEATSVSKLVDAIVTFQTESTQKIAQYRQDSASNAKEIETIVEAGKQRVAQAVLNYSKQPA